MDQFVSYNTSYYIFSTIISLHFEASLYSGMSNNLSNYALAIAH